MPKDGLVLKKIIKFFKLLFYKFNCGIISNLET